MMKFNNSKESPCGFIAFLLILVLASIGRTEDSLRDTVATRLATILQKQKFSGAVGITKGSEKILESGFRFANVEHNILNTADTKFRIGSLTKQFTAMAILILQEQKKVDLDAPIKTYLKSAPDSWDAITVHHLLAHTSGIPDFTSMDDYVAKMSLPQSNEEMLERFRLKPLDFSPGRGFRYSNSGYFVIGMIIESTSGMPYEEFLQKEIFAPLGMTDSGYDHFRLLIPGRADGYDVIEGEQYRAEYVHMSQPFSAGGLYSSVSDLLKWNLALQQRQLLSGDGYVRMWTANRGDYAYGWSVATINEVEIICHGGGINGFASFILRIPQKDLCVVVLSNESQTIAGRIASDLASCILERDIVLPKIRNIVDPFDP